MSMKIAICGSMQFAKEIMEISEKLKSGGHAVEIPKSIEEYAEGSKKVEDKWSKAEGDVIKGYFEKIKDSDAVLIVNFSKNHIENYIGGNSLIEMAFAHVLDKTIFLLNPAPSMSYSDEIIAMNPVVLYGDLKNIHGR